MASRPPSPAPRGFVLAVTLWLLAGIALVVALMTLWALDEVRSAASERERLDQRIAMLGTRDTILYLAATRNRTVAGLPTTPLSEDERAMRALDEFGGFSREPIGGELRLDGQPYQGLGDTVFAIQDETGLFSLVLPSTDELEQLLAARGVEREEIPHLRDTLLDYMDPDSLRHLNGAEARQYEQQSRPPPPNRRLLLPEEIRAVLGWSEIADIETLLPLLTTFAAGAVNLNTAPPALLPIWVDGCPEICTALVERRVRQPFQSSTEIQALFGDVLRRDDAIGYRYVAGDFLRLTLWGQSGAGLRIHVRLTPLADQRGPWSVLAAYPISRRAISRQAISRPATSRQATSSPAPHAPAQSTDSALFADPQADRP